MKLKLLYAYLEGDAVVFTDDPTGMNDEAWTFVGGTWVEMNHADAFCKASMMTRAAFNQMFPNLPPLPPEAFASSS